MYSQLERSNSISCVCTRVTEDDFRCAGAKTTIKNISYQAGIHPSRSSCSSFRTSSALVALARAWRIRFFSSAVISRPEAPGTNVLAIPASAVTPLLRVGTAVLRVEEIVVARDVGSLSGVRNNDSADFRSFRDGVRLSA